MDSRIEEWLEKGKGGYSLEELNAAFDQVKNPDHWKQDVDAVVPSALRNVLVYAIPWFTGSGEVLFHDLPDGRIRVVASGYWSNGMEG